MHLAKLVAALVAANLVAIGLVACSVRQSAEKVEQSVDLTYPEKEKKQ